MVVKAKWERPDRRRFLTVSAPLFVELSDGQRIRAFEWSLGGLRVVNAGPGVPQPGATETLKLLLPFQGFEISFLANAHIIESHPQQGSFAAEFIDLGERERGLLCHFLDELVRGSMTPVEDTIQRIDVPVAPVPLEPQSVAETSGAAKARSANPGIMTALYASLGLVVFGYLGLLLYSNLVRFEVDNARLTVEAERLVALGEGHLRRTPLTVGASVKSGDVLAYVDDNQLEREIDLAGLAVRESEAKVQLLQRQTGLDQQRTPIGARARLELDSLSARIAAAEQEVRRFAAMPRTAVNTLRLEEARKKLLSYQKTVESKQIDLTPFDAQIIKTSQDLEFVRQRLKVLTSHRERLAVRAPFDGIVVNLPHGDHSTVRKGDVVAVVEPRTVPAITAMLSPSDVMRIGLGEQARIYLPSSGAFMKARVTLIDRLGDPAQGNERLQATVHGGLQLGWSRVELQVNDPEILQDRTIYRSGLPVVVQFQRRWANALITALGKTMHETIATVRSKIGSGAHAAPRNE